MSGQFLPSVLPAACSLRHRFWGTGKGEVRFPHPTRSIPTRADFHNSEDGRFLCFFQKAGSAIPCRGSVVSNQHGKLHSMTTLLRFFFGHVKNRRHCSTCPSLAGVTTLPVGSRRGSQHLPTHEGETRIGKMDSFFQPLLWLDKKGLEIGNSLPMVDWTHRCSIVRPRSSVTSLVFH